MGAKSKGGKKSAKAGQQIHPKAAPKSANFVKKSDRSQIGAQNDGKLGKGAGKFRQDVYEYDDSDETAGKNRRYDIDWDPKEFDGLSKYSTVNEEDDEEIESDEAFDSSDEEKYDSFKFGNGSKAKTSILKSQGKKSHDGSDLEQDDFSEDGFDEGEAGENSDYGSEDEGNVGGLLSDMLDGPRKAESVDKKDSRKRVSFKDLLGQNSDSESQEEVSYSHKKQKTFEKGTYGEEGSNGEDVSEEESEDDETKDPDFRNFENKKKHDALLASLGVSELAKKPQYTREKSEFVEESEFSLSSVFEHKDTKIQLDDLISSIKDDDSLNTFKSSLEKVQKQLTKKDEAVSVLKAPLPKRIQEKFEREAAYTLSKDAVEEWQPIVNKNREAEHLEFPLNAPAADKKRGAFITTNFRAGQGLEKEIESILMTSGIDETNLRNYEELALQKESKEQMLARKAELRAVRELMFRNEQKAKRLAKIKSKTYRRILKKQKQKQLAKSGILDDGDFLDLEDQEKQEQKRAEERMTLKHKGGSAWAKEMQKFGKHNDEVRASLHEQLDQHDELIKKIDRQGSNGKASADSSDSEFDDNEYDERQVKAHAARQVDELLDEEEDQDELHDELGLSKSKKNLFKMKFMQAGVQRRKEEVAQQALLLKEELNPGAEDLLNLGVESSLGRRSFAPIQSEKSGKSKKAAGNKKKSSSDSTALPKTQTEERQNSTVAQEGSSDARNIDVKTVEQSKKHSYGIRDGPKAAVIDELAKADSNPWLEDSNDSSAIGRQTFDHALTDRSKKKDKASAKLRSDKIKALTQSAIEPNLKNSAPTAVINPNSIDTEQLVKNSTGKTEKNKAKRKKESLVASADSKPDSLEAPKPSDRLDTAKITKLYAQDSEGGSDEDSDTDGERESSGIFTQKELVERAFAMDAGAAEKEEFEGEAQRLLDLQNNPDSDKPSGFLPGWGTWAGGAISERKAKAKLQEKKDAAKDLKKYQIKKLESVIINPKKIKKNTKYLAESLPFPYNQAAHYTSAMNIPVGPEWNTASSVKKLVKPRIITKMGKTIQPLSKTS